MSVAPTTLCSASSSGASPNYNSCLGDACIAQSTVDAVVADLMKRLASYYCGAREKMAEGSGISGGNYTSALPLCALSVKPQKLNCYMGSLIVPYECDRFPECYFTEILVEDMTWIDKDTPLGDLVRKLRQRITELGVLHGLNRVSIRLNKGRVDHKGDFWHRDRDVDERRTVTVCYSNMKNWSTRIVDAAHNQKITGNGVSKNFSDEEIAALESVAQPSIHGMLYDGVIGIHRAPKLADLGANVPSSSDWRLFLAFI